MLKAKFIFVPFFILYFLYIVIYSVVYHFFFIKNGDVSKETHDIGNFEFILLLFIPFILSHLLLGHRFRLLSPLESGKFLYRIYIVSSSLALTISAAALQIGIQEGIKTCVVCLLVLVAEIFIPKTIESLNEQSEISLLNKHIFSL